MIRKTDDGDFVHLVNSVPLEAIQCLHCHRRCSIPLIITCCSATDPRKRFHEQILVELLIRSGVRPATRPLQCYDF
jgi:hypothetical protein